MLQNLAISYRGLLALLVAGTLLLTAACGRRSGTPSSTPSAPPSQASLNKADAEWIDPRRLVAEPAAYRNRHLALYGKAVTVEQRGDYTWVDLLAQPAGGTRTASVIVELRPQEPEIVAGQCYALFGIGAGTQQVTRTAAAVQNEVPLVQGYAWEPSPPNLLGAGCAP